MSGTFQNYSVGPINSTAGAVAVKNEKGQLVVQKVKVSRYVTGKAPQYADEAELSDSDEEVWPLGRGGSRFELHNDRRQRSSHQIEAAEEVEEEPILADVEDEEETFIQASLPTPVPVMTRTDDPRLRRLKEKVRQIAEPQIISDEMDVDVKEEQEEGELRARARESDSESDEEPLESVRADQLGAITDVGASERRRKILLERARERERQRDLEAEQQSRVAAKREAEVVEELEAELDALEEESEEEEEEEDERGPRLKPVFVRKKDRVTLEDEARRVEKERDEERQRRQQEKERKLETLRLIEDENRREMESELLRKSRLNAVGAPVVLGIGPGFRAVSSLPPGHAGLAKDLESGEEPKAAAATASAGAPAAGAPLGTAGAQAGPEEGPSELDVLEMRGLELIDTDDEKDEELSYEKWKLRETKRVKRDREERNKEQEDMNAELEKIRAMSEDDRREYFRRNQKVVINKADKGKMRFLQKYFHRGVFYLDNEDEVLKRDFMAPTLEDHFDKSSMPKVMQVKNFGRAGRTKWTHLVNEDTSLPKTAGGEAGSWTGDATFPDTSVLRFTAARGGGMKQHFARPSTRQRKG